MTLQINTLLTKEKCKMQFQKKLANNVHQVSISSMTQIYYTYISTVLLGENSIGNDPFKNTRVSVMSCSHSY